MSKGKIENTPSAMLATPVTVNISDGNKKEYLQFRLFSIADMATLEERYGGKESFNNKINSMSLDFLIPIFFNQLTFESKEKVLELKEWTADYNDKGEKYYKAEKMYDIFVNIFNPHDKLAANIYLKLKGFSDEAILEVLAVAEKKTKEILKTSMETQMKSTIVSK